jgi:2-succinyl-5-enolpyruvyl-6-hydroxy-3-cyclohexene-1-carboxylate synthase
MPEAAADDGGAGVRVDGAEYNDLGLFVGAFIDEMVRSGVSQVCLCPGSRSTPLAMLLREHPGITLWTHLDERSASYFALGMAKARCEPVAVVCTSGTAAVNFAPAVTEAFYSRAPLIVITADRPPELRGVGALQTIDQVRLYGTHVKWSAEATLPESSAAALRYARTLAARAVATASAPAAGPVHVNFPFREPLIPVGPPPSLSLDSAEYGRPSISVAQSLLQPDDALVAQLASDLLAAQRGVIICGPQDEPGFPDAVVMLAELLGYPVLADPLSQVRCGPHHRSLVIDSYEVFLRDGTIADSLAPDVFVRFGPMPVSKALMNFVQRHEDARHIVVDYPDKWPDFTFLASDIIHAEPRLVCEGLLAGAENRVSDNRDWLNLWEIVADRTRAGLSAGLSDATAASEPSVFIDLAELLPDGATVFAGNSMPVRDLDIFFQGSTQRVRILGNRGASGIDGVVSSALGASTAGGPLVLVIGDISFYHDMNGLLAAKRHNLNATIILLNNDGGGIFSFLPQVEYPEHYEELFGTPHGLDFQHAAAMYGLDYLRAASRDEFKSALQQAIAAPGVSLIEVPTERDANLRLHREVIGGVVKMLSDLLPQQVP